MLWRAMGAMRSDDPGSATACLLIRSTARKSTNRLPEEIIGVWSRTPTLVAHLRLGGIATCQVGRWTEKTPPMMRCRARIKDPWTPWMLWRKFCRSSMIMGTCTFLLLGLALLLILLIVTNRGRELGFGR